MVIEHWEFAQTNADQRYATHSFLRYFGKLPPAVTRKILEESRTFLKQGPVLDIACGSGTTLVEATLMGIESEGVDINPLSVLLSQTKTQSIQNHLLEQAWCLLKEKVSTLLSSLEKRETLELLEASIPNFHNRDLWFSKTAQLELAAIRHSLQFIKDEKCGAFLKVAFAGIIRRSSNASERVGRIFKDTDKLPYSPWTSMQKRVMAMRQGLAEYSANSNGYTPPVFLMDGKCTTLTAGHYGLVFFHPPYFALYKYSSDVLRFELEWLGYRRKDIALNEIRDGFKTTRVSDIGPYLADLKAVFKESRRLLHNRGALVVICNNSTLRKEQLPIISGILKNAKACGFAVFRHAVRQIQYSQSSYHRSADVKIRTAEDHIIFFVPQIK